MSKALFCKRQRFRIGLAELDVEPFGIGALAGALEQRRNIVGRDDVAPAARGRKRDVAVAGGDIEHLLAGADVEGFAELLADDLQRGADDRIVAGGPGRMLTRLHGDEIDHGGNGMSECSWQYFLSLKMILGSEASDQF